MVVPLMQQKESLVEDLRTYRRELEEVKTVLSDGLALSEERYKTVYDHAIHIVKMAHLLLRPQSELPDEEKKAVGELLRAEILPLVLLTETTSRFYTKPLGYAGDYQVLENIYHYIAGGKGRLGPVIDRIHLDAPTSVTVRNRRKLLAEYLLKFVRQSNKPVQIMCIAAGSAREIFDMYDQLEDPSVVRCILVDFDEAALAFAEQLSIEKKLTPFIRTIRENLPNLLTGRSKLNAPPLDLVYSMGVIDYFQDKYVVKLLQFIYPLLAPGGTTLLGNFHKSNPFKEYMDYVLEWKLIHRDEADMERLFQTSPFKKTNQIFFENQRLNMFTEARKER